MSLRISFRHKFNNFNPFLHQHSNTCSMLDSILLESIPSNCLAIVVVHQFFRNASRKLSHNKILSGQCTPRRAWQKVLHFKALCFMADSQSNNTKSKKTQKQEFHSRFCTRNKAHVYQHQPLLIGFLFNLNKMILECSLDCLSALTRDRSS